MNFGELIKKYRKERNWTQQMLADHLGTSRPQISEWETTTRKPNRITVKWLKLEGVL